MAARWRIQLLGGLRAQQGERLICRFRSQQTALLLAYLSYYPRRHPREVLIDLLWPEAEPGAGRHSLSQALSSLRHQLEPPGVPAGAIIVADRTSVELNPRAHTTDAAAFEEALRAADQVQYGPERAAHLAAAVELYTGPLLPGHYAEWVLVEQSRLRERFLGAVLELVEVLERHGEAGRGIEYAWRAVAAEPLRESAHHALIRLLLATDQPDAARRQYQEMDRRLREELDAAPSAASRQLLRRIEAAWLGLPGGQQSGSTGGSAPGHQIARPVPPRAEQSGVPAVDESPLRAAPANRGNVPLQLDRFFGRETELSQLRELLAPLGAAPHLAPSLSAAERAPRPAPPPRRASP
jgi:DNA-binding SARP family transcriptional activator